MDVSMKGFSTQWLTTAHDPVSLLFPEMNRRYQESPDGHDSKYERTDISTPNHIMKQINRSTFSRPHWTVISDFEPKIKYALEESKQKTILTQTRTRVSYWA